MAGVRLEFAQFGHFEYFNIYRNSVSTAIENLGQPIGISSTMYYEDLTVEPNRDYYYRAGAIRDSVEEFSEEIHTRTEVVFDPPYDLVIEFKDDEINRLELNWKLDGFVDEQRYYCSETPIDTENLPTAKAVLAGDVRTYVDTDIEIGKTYYVAVGSVKNGVEKLSGIVKAKAANVVFYAPFSSDILDHSGHNTLIVAHNGASLTTTTEFPSGCVRCAGSQYLTSSFDLNPAVDDFTLEFEFVANYASIFNGILAMHGQSGGDWSYMCLTGTSLFMSVDHTKGWNLFSELILPIVANQKHKFKLKKIGETYEVYLDNALIATKTNTSAYNLRGGVTFIGKKSNDLNRPDINYISSLEVTK
ncbi:hypothetical protein [Acinetobacter cumulans]|uniref:hypothetical protein n=1 Tax=Acinetobacter cumulans TaxID=2136182 RepID=UPI0018837BC1|nr:hypothetical protein [Acinetobacter cumulans]